MPLRGWPAANTGNKNIVPLNYKKTSYMCADFLLSFTFVKLQAEDLDKFETGYFQKYR